jgi:hypothetical protein
LLAKLASGRYFERSSLQGFDDITAEDVGLAKAARDFFFQPDGVIELDKLVSFIQQHTDALFQYKQPTKVN